MHMCGKRLHPPGHRSPPLRPRALHADPAMPVTSRNESHHNNNRTNDTQTTQDLKSLFRTATHRKTSPISINSHDHAQRDHERARRYQFRTLYTIMQNSTGRFLQAEASVLGKTLSTLGSPRRSRRVQESHLSFWPGLALPWRSPVWSRLILTNEMCQT